jgi:gliding motility-associated-like protein
MFDFGSSLAICAGGSVPVLPSTSANNITGTWSPAVISNQNSASYTFTPSGGQCATTTTFTVNVNSNTTPLFGFSSSLTICAGASVPLLPTTSNNSITGTWGPSTVSNQASGTYIFTPAGGQCATTSTFSVTVNPNITPTFSFGTTLTICANGTVPLLTNTSTNGINGTWSPATIDNENSAVYTFTPNSGECATTTTFSVTVNPIITPDFSFGTSLDICAGSAVPLLPATSSNGITGTWSPSVVSNQNSASYIFTPTSGQCATEAIFSVTVTPNIIPTFSFGTTLNICAGGNVPELPNTSENNITGTWSPAVIDNNVSAVYVFTPVTTPGQCISSVNFTVTVNPILIPTFNFGTTQTICAGSTVPLLPLVSTNGVTGTWSPAVVSNQNSGTYIFTTDAGQCALPDASFTMTVNALPTIDARTNITINDGTTVPLYTPSGTPAGLSFSWTNSNPAIGLAASGTGSVPSFIATNKGSASTTATITVTPILNGCSGLPRSYTITVIPLYKDVFVPNVFSPNGDGKNDILIVYGNYIEKLDMRIFNQWGEQVEKIDNKTRGWDGRHKGKAQPVGVYVYALEAVLTDGRTVKMKGYITLLR